MSPLPFYVVALPPHIVLTLGFMHRTNCRLESTERFIVSRDKFVFTQVRRNSYVHHIVM